MDDIIVAISTAVGVGSISIIRVSGQGSIKKVNSIFKGKNLELVDSHTINYGYIFYEGQIVDEVLVSVMKAPKTYTMEDVVEINLHGGIATTNKVLEILLNIGCRQAEPGEFTKRAFLNGRIDLVKAEAVNDVIEAESDDARKLSVSTLTGKLSNIIRSLKDDLLEIESKLEVNIDYPEYEDLEDMTSLKISNDLELLKNKIDKMIEESRTGKIIKSGINVAIVGKPNVGKSSILNALLEEDRAIVTNIEGTTRDIVEGKIILNGIVFNFYDTAGIRETSDIVEKIGVDKSLKVLENADLVILVLNYNEELTSEEMDLMERIKDKKYLIFVNKNDLEKKIDVLEDDKLVYGNTIKDDGLDGLKMRIIRLFELGDLSKKDFTYISNARQLSLIKNARDYLEAAMNAAKEGMPADIIEIDLSNARIALGEILGEVYDDELIDRLFANFCLGK